MAIDWCRLMVCQLRLIKVNRLITNIVYVFLLVKSYDEKTPEYIAHKMADDMQSVATHPFFGILALYAVC